MCGKFSSSFRRDLSELEIKESEGTMYKISEVSREKDFYLIH